MHTILLIFGILMGNRGPGLLVLLLAIVFILGLDKIIKLVVYLVDKISERKKNRDK
jgi:hypothetical protein